MKALKLVLLSSLLIAGIQASANTATGDDCASVAGLGGYANINDDTNPKSQQVSSVQTVLKPVGSSNEVTND